MAQTFHLFVTLPRELRHRIWFYILHEPRDTIIRTKVPRVSEIHISRPLLCFYPYTNPPAATQVCSESRAEALRVYTRAFAHGSEPRYAYINFTVDRVIISDEDLYIIPLSSPERALIRNLVLLCEETEYGDTVWFKRDYATSLTALEKLICISSDWDNMEPESGDRILTDMFEQLRGNEEGWVCPRISCRGVLGRVGFGLDEVDGGAYLEQYRENVYDYMNVHCGMVGWEVKE